MELNARDNVYCTLFDSNYLDKGLVMIRSLRKYSDATIYVLAMDDKCASILLHENIKYLKVIPLEDFLDAELRNCKETRSHGEFCWSCTSSLVLHIFEHFQEKICTYIDADLFFYTDPSILVTELIQSEKSVQIIRHNFKKCLDSLLQEKLSGIFCVQFNSFVNDDFSKEILKEWRKLTLEDSSIEKEGHFGDQKYLDKWPEKYKKQVNIIENQGAGVAPWNFERYSAVENEKNKVLVDGKSVIPIVFYHFHNMVHIDKQHINIHLYERTLHIDHKLVKTIYLPYIYKLRRMKEYLDHKYGFYPLIQEHPVLKKGIKNPLIRLQNINGLYHIATIYIRTKRKLVRAIAWKRNILPG